MKYKAVLGIMLTLLLISMLLIVSNTQPAQASGIVGVKAGDWIKVDYTITGWPAGTPYPEWLKVEFLSVEGTTATVLVTMHMSNGTEQNATVPVDVVAGGQAFGLSGFVIPANCTTGDSIYMSGYGYIIIACEGTRIYAGASRTVVCASLSQSGTRLTYYWDKQTGVIVEASAISDGLTATAKATETNMWEAAPIALPVRNIDTGLNYATIQEAIDAAGSGDTIFVYNGTYCEHIVVSKSVTLIGEDKDITIIDGFGADYVVEIAASNVSISGFTIQNGYRGPLLGFYYAGIYVGELSANNTISDNIITNNANGIQLDSTSGNNISNNIIKDNGYWSETSGIYVRNSSYNNIDNNYITRNQGRGISIGAGSEYNNISNNIVENHIGVGIYLIGSTYNNISNNTITSNKNGIRVAHAPFNFFSSNAMLNNTYNFGVNVIDPEDSIQDIDTSNTVNEKPIYYLLSQSNLIIEPSTFPEIGYLGIIAGNNLTLRDLTLTKNEQGLLLYGVSNSVVENVGTSYNFFGMVIMDSSNNTIKGCAITNNQDSGILLDGDNNTVSGNTISNNGEVKLYPDEVWGGWKEYAYGGIIGLSGDNNTIYHNNFINNIGSIDISGDGNSWDNGYPSGGNYWSDYNGTDFYNDPYQNETGSDGIGDTPYVIDEFNQDSYPLMRPFLYYEHDLAVSLRTSHYHCIYGTTSILEAAVYNLGLSDENNVRLELTIDDNVVDSIVIPQLASGSNYTYTLNYTWTPTVGDRYCNVTAYVNSVPGENITANNVASTPVLVYHLHDVAIVSVTPPEKWVIVEGMGQIVNINITIENKGTAFEYVTAQYRVIALGMPLIEWTTIGNVTNLSPSAEATLTFNLNTTGMLMGVNYTISIDAGLPDRTSPFREWPMNCRDNYYWFTLTVMPQLRVFNVTCEGKTYNVTTISHTPPSNFNFSQQEMQISFDLADPHPYPAAYCTVMIPNNLLTGNPWTITIETTPVTNFTETENETHTILLFNYTSTCHVTIEGIWVVPEFPSFLILPLFMALTLLAVMVYRRKHSM